MTNINKSPQPRRGVKRLKLLSNWFKYLQFYLYLFGCPRFNSTVENWLRWAKKKKPKKSLFLWLLQKCVARGLWQIRRWERESVRCSTATTCLEFIAAAALQVACFIRWERKSKLIGMVRTHIYIYIRISIYLLQVSKKGGSCGKTRSTSLLAGKRELVPITESCSRKPHTYVRKSDSRLLLLPLLLLLWTLSPSSCSSRISWSSSLVNAVAAAWVRRFISHSCETYDRIKQL